jgi:mannosyl-3-phosphoglycerate phosphatase family protein
LKEPFIVENGGATIIPLGYFKKSKFNHSKKFQNKYIIETGGSSFKIRSLLKKIRTKHKINFKGTSDLSILELSKITKLSEDYAKRMIKRKYSETIVQIDSKDMPNFVINVEELGLKVIPGGQYFDITLGNDKGTAAKILMEIFRKEYENNVIFFGIGDSKNDESMLSLMNHSILVQKPDASWQNLRIDNLQKVKGIGTRGWEVALEIILNYNKW